MSRFTSFTTVAAITLISAFASAQTGKAAIAEQAFLRGKDLMAEGKSAEACPKFEESHRLDPSVGALLNLGRCYDQLGRTASAWARYKEAAALARTLGQTERETAARDLATAIEPRLSRLRIDMLAPVANVRIVRDTEEIGAALLGDPLAVDPGQHTIEVTAPGYKRWSTQIEIGKEADVKTVSVPALEVEPNAPKAAATSNGLRTTAFVVGGVGVVALGAGAVFGGLASSDKSAADASCPNKACDAAGFAHVEDAKSKALISTISFGVGAGALGAGIILFLVSRSPAPAKDAAPRAWIVPSFGAQSAGASLVGSF